MSSKLKKANYGYLRESFNVRRYHTVGYIAKPDTVGLHTVNIIAMLFHIYDDNPPVDLIRVALHHDAPELATGDLPATAKWAHEKMANEVKKVEEGVAGRQGLDISPKPEYVVLLKYVDMLELCYKCVEEMAYGNSTIAPILANGLNFVKNMLEKDLKGNFKAQELFETLKSNPFVAIEEFFIDVNPNEARH